MAMDSVEDRPPSIGTNQKLAIQLVEGAPHLVTLLALDDVADETRLSCAVQVQDEPPAPEPCAAEQPNVKVGARRRVALVLPNFGREPLLRMFEPYWNRRARSTGLFSIASDMVSVQSRRRLRRD